MTSGDDYTYEDKYKEIRDKLVNLLEKIGIDPRGSPLASIIVYSIMVNHPIPEKNMIYYVKELYRELANLSPAEVDDKRIDDAIRENLRVLIKKGLLIETDYYLGKRCYTICRFDDLPRKLSEFSNMDEKMMSKIRDDIIEFAKNLAKEKPTLGGWQPIDRVVSNPNVLKCTETFFVSGARTTVKEYKEAQDRLKERTKWLFSTQGEGGKFLIRSFFIRWLVSDDMIGLFKQSLERGFKFEVIINPKPPGGGGEEWNDNLRKLLHVSRKYGGNLRIYVRPPRIAFEHLPNVIKGLVSPYPLYMTLRTGIGGIVFFRDEGTIRIHTGCYTEDKSILRNLEEIFNKYKSRRELIKEIFEISDTALRESRTLSSLAQAIFIILGPLLGSILAGTLGLLLGFFLTIALKVIFGLDNLMRKLLALAMIPFKIWMLVWPLLKIKYEPFS